MGACLLLSVAVALAFSGCSTLAPIVTAPVVRWEVPVPILVTPGHQLAAAEWQAGLDETCFALMGAGRSMEPVYPSGTALVVRERSFRMLRAGQAIVYRNHRGGLVAHVLVQQLDEGWIARGLNNAQTDGELVTELNFVGVVLAAFAPAHMPANADLVGRNALREGNEIGAFAALYY